MSWNHRVIRRYADINGIETPFYTIHEVYYENDEIVGWIEAEKAPFGDTINELLDDLELFHGAFEHPVIDIKWLTAYFEERRKSVGKSGDIRRPYLH